MTATAVNPKNRVRLIALGMCMLDKSTEVPIYAVSQTGSPGTTPCHSNITKYYNENTIITT